MKLRRISKYENFKIIIYFHKEEIEKFTKNKNLRKKKFLREIIYINNESL